MSALPQEQIVSDAEFWELVKSSNERLEHVRGRVYAMAGGSYNHSRIMENLSASLKTRLRSTGCSATGSNFHMQVEETGEKFLPDNAIHCGQPRLGENGYALLNPVCLFEVLSPSTQIYDQNEKFDTYARIASLQDYVLIWANFVKVAHYTRREGGWLLKNFTERTDELSLQGTPTQLSVSELYDELDVPVQTILFPRPESAQTVGDNE